MRNSRLERVTWIFGPGHAGVLGPMFTISVSVERKRKAQLAKLFVETGVTLEARRLSPDVTVTS